MALAWGGGDPVDVVDSEDYELGTAFRVDADLTINRVRVWAGAAEGSVSNRRARIWTGLGSLLATVTLPNTLTSGYSLHDLDAPLEVTSGTTIVVSRMTGGNYGALASALDADVPSGDGAVVALAAAGAPNGANGRFNETPGAFPVLGAGSHPYYGVEFEYTLGIGGNTAPVITAFTATAAGATVTATVQYTDAETLVGSTTRFSWGDNTADTVVTYPTVSAQHTYTSSYLYAVLATVTDASGATDHAAVPVQVDVPSSEVLPLRAVAILNAVVTHALRLGYFERVNQHDPGNPSGFGLTADIWVTKLSPIKSSGLNISSARLALIVRISSNINQTPGDAIDPNIIVAASALMGAYIGGFTLGGLIRQVDVFGAHGPPLDCDIGYRPTDENRYRTAVIALPLVINNLWEEVA